MILPPKEARILVAMSGGVDSAAAAAKLVEAGYDCIGVTMRLVPEHPGKPVFEPCCGLEAAEDARRFCERLGIPHRTVHAVDRFERDIIGPFMDAYLEGRTPNPCVRCNRMIKFGALYQYARKTGAEYIAMGHYVRLEERGGRMALRRPVFLEKDQSYVLAPLTQPQLRRAVFPLGEATKGEARALALTYDYTTSQKRESQEICFVPDRRHGQFIVERRGSVDPGPIVNREGEVLGEHQGLVHYTVGQRRGLGVAAPRPLYVVALDVPNNTLVVGYDEETLCREFTTGVLCWGALPRQEEPFSCLVQLRSRHTPGPATVKPARGGAQITLHEPQRAVTPGQWAVCYDTDGYVLAAAIIRDSTPEPAGAAPTA